MSQVRMTRESRREQLLDVAAAMLLESGPGSLTMEGLAARSGVSKALPYSHFENADGVVAALWEREIAQFGTRILAAVDATGGGEAAVQAAVHAYFDVVTERGAILQRLVTPGGRAGGEVDRTGTTFVAELFQRMYDLPRKRALLVAEMTQGLLLGAVTSLAHGDASRSAIERAATAAILSTIDAAGDRAAVGVGSPGDR